MKHRLVWAPLALFFASVPAAWSIRSGPQLVRLPGDTVMKVKLGETIGSDRSQNGDPFTATVHDSSLPQGTLVRGVVIGSDQILPLSLSVFTALGITVDDDHLD